MELIVGALLQKKAHAERQKYHYFYIFMRQSDNSILS